MACVFLGEVPVELRGSVSGAGEGLPGLGEGLRGEHVAAEVGGVERPAEHGLVDLPQLGEGERFAEEAVRDRAVLDLVPEPPEGVVDDAPVVEGEGREVVDGVPAHVVSEAGGARLLASHERPVDDRDDAGVVAEDAVGVAEGVELLEVLGREAHRLEEGARGGGAEVFVAEWSAWEGEEVDERLALTAHERHPDRGRWRPVRRGRGWAQREDHRGDGEGRVGGGHPLLSSLLVVSPGRRVLKVSWTLSGVYATLAARRA